MPPPNDNADAAAASMLNDDINARKAGDSANNASEDVPRAPVAPPSGFVESKFSTGEQRFRDLNELKYAMRSVYAYAPWVRRLYLVTSGEHPVWLNTSHPLVRLVRHEDIVYNPAVNAPAFSSNMIETGLHRIPGLSDNFIYSNDDFLITKPVPQSAFWSPEHGTRLEPSYRYGSLASKITLIGDGLCHPACMGELMQYDLGDCERNYLRAPAAWELYDMLLVLSQQMYLRAPSVDVKKLPSYEPLPERVRVNITAIKNFSKALTKKTKDDGSIANRSFTMTLDGKTHGYVTLGLYQQNITFGPTDHTAFVAYNKLSRRQQRMSKRSPPTLFAPTYGARSFFSSEKSKDPTDIFSPLMHPVLARVALTGSHLYAHASLLNESVSIAELIITTPSAASEPAYCAPGCPASWAGDGVCDSTCDVESCGWDRGDCVLSPTAAGAAIAEIVAVSADRTARGYISASVDAARAEQHSRVKRLMLKQLRVSQLATALLEDIARSNVAVWSLRSAATVHRTPSVSESPVQPNDDKEATILISDKAPGLDAKDYPNDVSAFYVTAMPIQDSAHPNVTKDTCYPAGLSLQLAQEWVSAVLAEMYHNRPHGQRFDADVDALQRGAGVAAAQAAASEYANALRKFRDDEKTNLKSGKSTHGRESQSAADDDIRKYEFYPNLTTIKAHRAVRLQLVSSLQWPTANNAHPSQVLSVPVSVTPGAWW